MNINVKVAVVPERTMYLKQHFGEGSLGKTKFDASFTLPGMSLLVNVGEKTYIVSSQDLITAVIENHEKVTK